MKSANVKGMVVKSVMAAMVAGALMVAAPSKAEAQIAVGVQFGQPVYHSGYGYDRFDFERRQDFLRRQEFERREAIRRHEEWMRAHRFERRDDYRGYR